MSVKISDKEGRNNWLRQKYYSNEHWIFFVDRNFYNVLIMIEEKFYNSKSVKDANADFDVSFSPSEPLTIATGHKRRLSKEQLKAFFSDIGAKGISLKEGFDLSGGREFTGERDVILLFKPTPQTVGQFEKIVNDIKAKTID